MYVETLHDAQGNIKGCYCADTLPADDGAPLFTVEDVPAGWEQTRINLDTLTAMEVESACRSQAVTDPATGRPVIARKDRAEYLMENYTVDVSTELAPPAGPVLPTGMKMRGLKKKTTGGSGG